MMICSSCRLPMLHPGRRLHELVPLLIRHGPAEHLRQPLQRPRIPQRRQVQHRIAREQRLRPLDPGPVRRSAAPAPHPAASRPAGHDRAQPGSASPRPGQSPAAAGPHAQPGRPGLSWTSPRSSSRPCSMTSTSIASSVTARPASPPAGPARPPAAPAPPPPPPHSPPAHPARTLPPEASLPQSRNSHFRTIRNGSLTNAQTRHSNRATHSRRATPMWHPRHKAPARMVPQ